jgi:hypothetical protein
MRQCAEHVTFQLPHERTRVTYLLDAIQNSDPGLQAAMVQVQTDTDPATGRMNDFEATASYLLPYDPVAKKRNAGTKRGVATISDTTAEVSSLSTKSSAKVTKGKTGVEFRFYKGPEYAKLLSTQKEELKEWRDAQKLAGTHNLATGPKSSKKPRDDGKEHKKWIASAVKASMKEKAPNNAVNNMTELDFKNYIWSLMAMKDPQAPAASAASLATTKPAPAKTDTLQSILRKANPKK